jgi:hypothetical protein
MKIGIAADTENHFGHSANHALDWLRHLPDLLPERDAGYFRSILDRLEAGDPFESAFGLPSDWRRRERDRLLRSLASARLSPGQIEKELKLGTKSQFNRAVVLILRLSNGRTLCARQITRIVRQNRD